MPLLDTTVAFTPCFSLFEKQGKGCITARQGDKARGARQGAWIIIINCKSYLCLLKTSGLSHFSIGPLYLTFIFVPFVLIVYATCPCLIHCQAQIDPCPDTTPSTEVRAMVLGNIIGAKAKVAMFVSNVPDTGNKVAKAKADKRYSIEGGPRMLRFIKQMRY
jgi:hypothetical protein